VWKPQGQDKEKKGPTVHIQEIDEEDGQIILKTRGVHLQKSVLVALAIILVVAALGTGFRQLSVDIAVDGSFLRSALTALTPIQIFLTLFFGQVFVGCFAQLFGPIRQMSVNSKFYSAQPPLRIQGQKVPHITIQCPVHKEGLTSVIEPTVKSLKQAIATYELQGGSANLFINDDGLQIISENDRRARINFYADHGIGWVARPGHGDNFIRKGKCQSLFLSNICLKTMC
jgi:hypothetical protein